MTMISEDELFLVYELYVQNGRQFGFYVVNSLPRSYVKVLDFGRFRTYSGVKTWHPFNPDNYSESEARKQNLGYRADRYDLGSHDRAGKDLFISDSKGWSRHQP